MQPKACFFTLVLVLAGPAAAEPLKAPTTDYTADIVFAVDSETPLRFRAFFSQRCIRVEMQHGLVLLADYDRAEQVVYAPWLKEYTVEPLGSRIDVQVGLSAEHLEALDRLGIEVRLGREVTKYRVRGIMGGGPFEGYVWLTAENIPVRIEGTFYGYVPQKVLIEATQLELAPVASDAFRVPSEYQKVSDFSQMVMP